MATIRFGKLDDYMLKLSELKADTPKIAGKAIYAGADIVADQVKENLSKLDTVTDREGITAAKKKYADISDGKRAPRTDRQLWHHSHAKGQKRVLQC